MPITAAITAEGPNKCAAAVKFLDAVIECVCDENVACPVYGYAIRNISN